MDSSKWIVNEKTKRKFCPTCCRVDFETEYMILIGLSLGSILGLTLGIFISGFL
jgi:hypothetical protein